MVIYRFGPFALDVTAFRLCRADQTVPASPQSLELLSQLLARPAQLVPKEALLATVWPDANVTENALTKAVSELRQLLGDVPATPVYIQTVARRGYRFIAPVICERPRPASAFGPHRPRETASLDAVRLCAEGRVRLESLDQGAISLAIDNFSQAIEWDPAYAPAHIGLANAYVWLYERTRYQPGHRTDLLTLAVKAAHCAQRIDGLVGEAHATLAYALTASDRLVEARDAAQRAIALEPDHWAHHFRFAHASWGESRLQALQRCRDLYAAFPFAHFQIAMVYVARGDLDAAEGVLRRGVDVVDGHAPRRLRFPASGLHWLLGLVHLRRGDPSAAQQAFAHEREAERGQLYGTEFALAAHTAAGFACLQAGQIDEAVSTFRQTLDRYAVQPRAHLGLAAASGRRQGRAEAAQALDVARAQADRFALAGRETEAVLYRAGAHVAAHEPAAAITLLETLLATRPAGPAGWLIPIDPMFEPLHAEPGFASVLRALGARAQ